MLSNEQIVLRPLKIGDEALFFQWRNNLEYIRNTKSFRLPKTEGLESEWVNQNMTDTTNKNVIFIIEHEEMAIGFIQLTGIDWISRNCYFGIAICEKEYRSKGFAHVSMHLLFDYAFNHLGIHKISLEVTDFNQNAIQLYEHFGFEKEGTLKEHYYWADNYHDVLLYGLLKSNYRIK